MPQHFVNLPGAATLPTRQYQLAGQIIEDLIAESGDRGGARPGRDRQDVRGPGRAGTAPGRRARPGRSQVSVCTLAFPAKPTMRLVADELLTALTGAAAPRSRNRFQLISRADRPAVRAAAAGRDR